jgi:DNA processing protein
MPSDSSRLEFLVSLSNLSFLSLKEKNILLNNLDSSSALALLSMGDISRLINRRPRGIWDGNRNRLLAKRTVHIMNTLGITVLLNSDAEFPALLREAEDAPFLLFCRGDLSCLRQKSVSVVGTRQLTAGGREEAYRFAYKASCDGYTVVSGLAHGTDGAAHEGAVDAFFDMLEKDDAAAEHVGRTCAVLPGGVDEIVPASHKRLAERIIRSGGCIISECAPGVAVQNWRFVQRNRIIAALSPATVVVEAPPGSGALITADFAAGYGRDVLLMKAAFSEQAQKIALQVKQTKERKAAGSRKHVQTIAQYIDDGAPVVADYEDFCRCLAEKPGKRSIKIKEDGQLMLFSTADSEEG